jgi:hypothetical protein
MRSSRSGWSRAAQSTSRSCQRPKGSQANRTVGNVEIGRTRGRGRLGREVRGLTRVRLIGGGSKKSECRMSERECEVDDGVIRPRQNAG